MTYITVAGIKRSGSTWLANAIKTIYEQAGYRVWMGEHRPDLGLHHPNGKLAQDGFPDYDIVINKVHPYFEVVKRQSDFIILSYRDLLEIMHSWERFRDSTQPAARMMIRDWCTWYYQWLPHADFEMQYKMLEDQKGGIIESLIFLFGLVDVDGEVVEKELEALKPPTDKEYDPETLMFSNHITSR